MKVGVTLFSLHDHRIGPKSKSNFTILLCLPVSQLQVPFPPPLYCVFLLQWSLTLPLWCSFNTCVGYFMSLVPYLLFFFTHPRALSKTDVSVPSHTLKPTKDLTVQGQMLYLKMGGVRMARSSLPSQPPTDSTEQSCFPLQSTQLLPCTPTMQRAPKHPFEMSHLLWLPTLPACCFYQCTY